MVTAEKPLDLIARELWHEEQPDSVAEDIITSLEDAGWRLVWCGDVRDDRVAEDAGAS